MNLLTCGEKILFAFAFVLAAVVLAWAMLGLLRLYGVL